MENKITIEQFTENMKAVVESMLESEDGEISVESRIVTKINDTILHGLVFRHTGNMASPVCYMEPYFQEFSNGADSQELGIKILKAYAESRVSSGDFEWFRSFEEVKGKIAYRLVNRINNVCYLEDKPYKEVLDLAKVYYVKVPQMQDAVITIKRQHMENWGITADELDAIAGENTEKLYPAEIRPISEVMMEIIDSMEEDKGKLEEMAQGLRDEPEPLMYVASNVQKLNGAAVMLYNSLIRNFAEKMEKDIIILPSSTHEVILLPWEEGTDLCELQKIVREVNHTNVTAEEVLSESIYCYSRAAGCISCVA